MLKVSISGVRAKDSQTDLPIEPVVHFIQQKDLTPPIPRPRRKVARGIPFGFVERCQGFYCHETHSHHTPHRPAARATGHASHAVRQARGRERHQRPRKRAWESAPAEKKALWQQQRDALKHIDLSPTTRQRQIVIARGSPKPDEYHAHPTTAMLADNKTIFCVWNIGHGGHAGPMARSEDAGLTWKRIDDALPPNYVNFKNCPSIYRITDPQGKERLWVFAARTLTDKENPKLIAGRHRRLHAAHRQRGRRQDLARAAAPRRPRFQQGRSVSLHHDLLQHRAAEGRLVARPVPSRQRHRRGRHAASAAIHHARRRLHLVPPTVACDGTKLDGKHPCEPYVFRSPDGNELCCLMRENAAAARAS